MVYLDQYQFCSLLRSFHNRRRLAFSWDQVIRFAVWLQARKVKDPDWTMDEREVLDQTSSGIDVVCCLTDKDFSPPICGYLSLSLLVSTNSYWGVLSILLSHLFRFHQDPSLSYFEWVMKVCHLLPLWTLPCFNIASSTVSSSSCERSWAFRFFKGYYRFIYSGCRLAWRKSKPRMTIKALAGKKLTKYNQ
jgi:hypothetical protein